MTKYSENVVYRGALISNDSAITDMFYYSVALSLIALGILMLLGDMGLLVTWGFGFLNGPYSALLKYM